jgi:hypothetical protein
MRERTASTVAHRAVGLVAVAALLVGAPACGNSSSRGNDRSRGKDRWVSTNNTSVDIDWDAVGKAFRDAKGPEDFEKRVNEIYTGDEVISVAVQDLDDKSQEVTGFFDSNTDGKVEESEKVFTIRRDLKGADKAQYRVSGHGRYGHYRSPMWDIASGMAMGYMLSRAFSPSYRPAYTQPYVTSTARHGELTSHRDGYRQKNPEKFSSGKTSKSGRTYGSKGSNYGGGKPSSASTPSPSSTPSRPSSRGGGRFGRRGRPAGRVVRLLA